MFRKTCSETLQLCKWGERGQETELLKVFDYLVHQLNKTFSSTGSYHTHVGPNSGAHLFFYSAANMAPPTCSLCPVVARRSYHGDISSRRSLWAQSSSQKKLPRLFQKSVGPEVFPRRNYQDPSRGLGWAPSGRQKKLPWRFLFQRIALSPKQFPEETTMTPPEECWARSGSQKKLPGLFRKIGLGPQWSPEEVTVEISLPEDRFEPKAVPRRNYHDSSRRALGPKWFPEETSRTLPEDWVGPPVVTRRSYRGYFSSRGSL